MSPCGEHLAVAEGIETALSVQLATGIPAWSALSANGIRALRLPPLPLATVVTIAADPDPVGMNAACDAAERWLAEGREVRIAAPPLGHDFNDLLRAQ
ncbi:toprim domain-containing protein [Microvirga sp. P5_D2]